MIGKKVRANLLYDFYGNLLTEKQKQMMELYFQQDMSLAEISEETGISRQAVHDTIKRTEAIIEEYEEKLGLVQKYLHQKQKADQLKNRIAQLTKDRDLPKQEALEILQKEIDWLLDDEV